MPNREGDRMNSEMKEYEVEELVQLYERMIENIVQFSLEAELQIEKLKGFVVADELASNISDIAKPYALILFQNEWISQKQFTMIEEIDKKLEIMSADKQLWTETALINSKEWEQCRQMGKELLGTLEK